MILHNQGLLPGSELHSMVGKYIFENINLLKINVLF
jgi:hypothetical protein